MNIIKFSVLGLIIMYIYGIIGYYEFDADYDADNGGIADTFILAIASTIK